MTDHDLRDRLRAGADPLRVDPDDALAAFHRARPRRDRIRRVATITTALALAALAFAITWIATPLGDGGTTPATPTGQTVPEPSGTIAFMLVTDDGESSHLVTVDVATGDVVGLTSPDSFAAYPVWSPDGRSIAFGGGTDYDSMRLVVADADGRNQRDLGVDFDGAGLAWSPDGTTLLYVGPSDGGDCCDAIATIGSDGEGAGRIVNGGGWQGASWAPDGSRIAMVGHPATRDNVMGPEDWDIYTVGIDGSDLTQLTRTEGWEHGVSYSPDGSTILFTRSPNYDDADYDQDVWVMDADGSNERKLTDWKGFDGFPAWSSDGEWIVFASDRDASAEQQEAFRRGDAFAAISLFIMRADGSDIRRIATADVDQVLIPGSWTAN